MPKLPPFQPSSEADLRARSRPPHGAPDPKTASARSPRAPAVTPPPRPAPPPRATPRGPPLKLAFFQNLPDFAFFHDILRRLAALPRPRRRLHPREGGLKFGQKLLARPAAQALRSGGARPEANSA